MTSILKKAFIILFYLLLFSILAKAQTDNCSDKLQQAQQLFESGQIEQIPFLLDSCINSGFTKEQKIKAYRLLIQTYLFDSNINMADSIMLRLLNQIPDYRIEPADPVEFVELYNNFKVTYEWSVGISLGSNISHIGVIENYSLFNLNKLNSTYSSDGPGLNIGVFGNKYIKNNLWVSVALDFCSLKYKNSAINSLNTSNTNAGSNNTEQVIFQEKSKWYTIPFTINRSFYNTTVKPVVQLGGEFDFLSLANADIQILNFNGNTSVSNTNASSVSLSGLRNTFNISVLAGVGAVMNTDYGLFQFMLGYRISLLPYVNAGARYTDTNMIYQYQHIDDNFKINNVYFTLFYSHLLYTIKNNRIINEASK